MLKEGKTSKYSSHGMVGTRLYRTWQDMKKRCYSPQNKSFHRYGGRGIKVCPEWHDFSPFMNWASANGYRDDLTLDRIDSNEDYSPDNCRWATQKVQQNNRRNNRLIEIDGVTKTAHEWADAYSVKYKAFMERLHLGWDAKTALTTPVTGVPSHYRLITLNGETHTISGWSKIVGIPSNTISARLRSGWSEEKAVMSPPKERK